MGNDLDADFWHERWRLKQIGFHQEEINAHLQSFWPGLGLDPGTRIFVPLCGKSSDMLWLRARGHGVLGVEISPIAVQEFFSDNQLNPRTRDSDRFVRHQVDGLELWIGDFFDLAPADLADCAGVYDRASLVALPPVMRERYRAHLGEILPDAAEILLVTMEYPDGQMQGPPFSVHEKEVRELYQDGYRIERLLDRDMLAENPRFRDKGLTQLREKVYRLTPLA